MIELVDLGEIKLEDYRITFNITLFSIQAEM